MDPDATLVDALRLAELYRETEDVNVRERYADELVSRVNSLAEWTRDGGYEPSWPQCPLTDGEVRRLRGVGHHA
jgi:hypothetical protein